MIAVILAAAAFLGGGCAEDDACWNWATMGDGGRGVRLLDGTRRVVGPCTFNRLAKAGRLAYWPMKGDLSAVQVCDDMNNGRR